MDPCADVSDVKINLAKSLHTLCLANPNVVGFSVNCCRMLWMLSINIAKRSTAIVSSK